MNPEIRALAEKKLIGKRMQMTFAENKTFELWRSFMPLRKEIKNNLNNELISMQVYDKSFNLENVDVNAVFEKWAALEVSDLNVLPDGMETFTLVAGLYAVFLYKGLNTDTEIFNYIFSKWLPASDYSLDNRPHFETLGEKYKNNDPDSEEEIWIPVKKKNNSNNI
jgi:AraC family transcriptional regulator